MNLFWFRSDADWIWLQRIGAGDPYLWLDMNKQKYGWGKINREIAIIRFWGAGCGADFTSELVGFYRSLYPWETISVIVWWDMIHIKRIAGRVCRTFVAGTAEQHACETSSMGDDPSLRHQCHSPWKSGLAIWQMLNVYCLCHPSIMAGEEPDLLLNLPIGFRTEPIVDGVLLECLTINGFMYRKFMLFCIRDGIREAWPRWHVVISLFAKLIWNYRNHWPSWIFSESVYDRQGNFINNYFLYYQVWCLFSY